MQLKAVITRGAPEGLVEAFASELFAGNFLKQVVGACLGAQEPIKRPAEFYVQEPDRTVCVNGHIGVELRFTGVSRNGRKAKQFHAALTTLETLARQTISHALTSGGSLMKVQLFCVLMLDGDVETSPGSGQYSNVLETEAIWVSREAPAA